MLRFSRRASARTSSPAKIRLNPQEINDASMLIKATYATAPRPVRGNAASLAMSHATGGAVATT